MSALCRSVESGVFTTKLTTQYLAAMESFDRFLLDCSLPKIYINIAPEVAGRLFILVHYSPVDPIDTAGKLEAPEQPKHCAGLFKQMTVHIVQVRRVLRCYTMLHLFLTQQLTTTHSLTVSCVVSFLASRPRQKKRSTRLVG